MKCAKCGKDANTAKVIAPSVYHCLDCYEDIRECHFCHKRKPVKHCQWFSSWMSWYPDDDYGSTFYEKHTGYACGNCQKREHLEVYSKDRKG